MYDDYDICDDYDCDDYDFDDFDDSPTCPRPCSGCDGCPYLQENQCTL